MRFPSTISVNIFKAYINFKTCKDTSNKNLNGIDLDWDKTNPDSLNVLCIKTISENWLVNPIFTELTSAEDRNFLLDILDVNLPLAEVCTHIHDDIYWKRCYQNKWAILPGNLDAKPWIRIYLEKFCSETIEMMKPSEYDPENILTFAELCSPFVEKLKIEKLQPSQSEDNHDHVPFNLILPNLNELRTLDLTFNVKDIGTQFFMGCASMSPNDLKNLVAGLEKCYELREFRLSSTKLEPYMLKMIARALEKGCPYIERIHLPHCRSGDLGLMAFLDTLSYESFPHLKDVGLMNNFISQDGALELAEAIKCRQIERLDMRLNPLTSHGCAVIFTTVASLPLKYLNLASCSIDETIDVLLIKLLKSNETLKCLDLSTNKLDNDLGENIIHAILANSKLPITSLNVRNCNISSQIQSRIDKIVLANRHEL